MRGINRVFILGRLGQDITLQQTKTGHSFVDLKIATSRSLKKDDEWTSETDWHTVRFWSKQAETCAKYLAKGSPIAVEGILRTEQWTNSNGDKRSKTYVVGSELHLLPNPISKKEAIEAEEVA